MAGEHELSVTVQHIQGMEFKVSFDWPEAGERERLERCLGLFEEYCTVTASVRHGIPVAIEVVDRDGGTLFASAH